MTGRSRLSYVPALDGIRALAVAAVLAFHGGFDWAAGGFLGVSAFFTLSGFLITSLLLLEREDRGALDLAAFWSRRARRLLPAALAALGGIVVFGVTVATGDQLRELRGDVLSALGYCANWRFLFSGHSYADLFEAPSPVQHFWSLAIEEQFYVVFPLLAAGLLALGRGSRRLFGAGLALLTAGSAALMVVLASPYRDTARVYYGTDTRATELLLGALLACLVAGRKPLRSRGGRAAADVGGWTALATLLVLWTRLDQGSRGLYEGGLTVHAMLTAALIFAVLQGGPLAALLGSTPLRALGKISYGVYLYHWPVFLWLSPERTGLGSAEVFALRAAVTLALATLSYTLLEQPIRSGRRLTGWHPRLVTPAAAATVVLALVAVTAAPPQPMIVFAPASASGSGDEPPTGSPPTGGPVARVAQGAQGSPVAHPVRPRGALPRTTAPTSTTLPPPPELHRPLDAFRPVRVMVVGDSVGLSLGRGLERWGESTGQAVVWNRARMYCSLGRYAERVYGVGIEHQSDVCDGWARSWAEDIAAFDPDTVVVLFSFWELVGRRLPEWDHFLMPGDAAFDAWLLSEYQVAADVLAARGARVVWLTLPCLKDTEKEATVDIDHVNELTIGGTAESRPDSVRVVDLFAWLCPDRVFAPQVAGVADGRPDGAHFSDPGSDAAAAWLGPQLVAA